MNGKVAIRTVVAISAFALLALSLWCCNEEKPAFVKTEVASEVTSNWRDYLKANIGLLGHRNWIVVTDMAYPLQSRSGIITIDTAEDYFIVLSYVNELIEKQPHIRAVIHQDLELKSLTENKVKGIDTFKEKCYSLFEGDINFEEHESLITKLDEVSLLFNVVILKTNLTMPFTSCFFELDCKYWD